MGDMEQGVVTHVVYSGVLRPGVRSKCFWRKCCSCSTTGFSVGAKGARFSLVGVGRVVIADPRVRRGGGCWGISRRVVYRHGCRLRCGCATPMLKLMPLRLSVAVVVEAAVVVASVVGASVVAPVLVGVVVVVAVVVVVGAPAVVVVSAPMVVVTVGVAVGVPVDVVLVLAPAVRTHPLVPLAVGVATIV